MKNLAELSAGEVAIYEMGLGYLAQSDLPVATREQASMAAALYAGLSPDFSKPGEFLLNYPILKKGKYHVSEGGELKISATTLAEFHFALNKMVSIGKPISLTYNHDSMEHGGFIIASEGVKDGVLYAHIFGDTQLIFGLRAGLFSLSMEAIRDFAELAYTGSEKQYEAWPTAWAALPSNVLPAVPAQNPLPLGELGKLIAAAGKHTVIHCTFEGEDGIMEERIKALETLVASLVEKLAGLLKEKPAETKVDAELTAENQRLATENKKLVEEKEATVVKAQTDEIAKRTEVLLARIPVGKREAFTASLAKADSPASKLAALDCFEIAVPEEERKEKRKFSASLQTGGNAEDTHVALMKKAGNLAVEKGCSLSSAVSMLAGEE